MNNYFYILVGIVWLLSSIYQSVQKKKGNKKTGAVPPSGNSPEKKERTIETILEEILTGKQQPQKQVAQNPSPVRKPVARPPKPSYSKEATVNVTNKEVVKGNAVSYETAGTQKNSIDATFESHLSVETPADEITFDLRNAVIYSEIMSKPKYLSDI